jgi:hypothetical protein
MMRVSGFGLTDELKKSSLAFDYFGNDDFHFVFFGGFAFFQHLAFLQVGQLAPGFGELARLMNEINSSVGIHTLRLILPLDRR